MHIFSFFFILRDTLSRISCVSFPRLKIPRPESNARMSRPPSSIVLLIKAVITAFSFYLRPKTWTNTSRVCITPVPIHFSWGINGKNMSAMDPLSHTYIKVLRSSWLPYLLSPTYMLTRYHLRAFRRPGSRATAIVVYQRRKKCTCKSWLYVARSCVPQIEACIVPPCNHGCAWFVMCNNNASINRGTGLAANESSWTSRMRSKGKNWRRPYTGMITKILDTNNRSRLLTFHYGSF